MKKHICLFLAGVLALSAGAFDFARGGKALCEIAVPAEMTDLEMMARDDLAGILKKITGADFRIVREDLAKTPAIYLGGTRYAAAKGFGKSKFADEEWLIRTEDGNLILTGGGLAGAYYAVQALLRKMGITC